MTRRPAPLPRFALAALVVAGLGFGSWAAQASDIAPKPDNGISAHELASGQTIWTNDEVEFGNTSLRLDERGILEVLDRVPNESDERVYLRTRDGSLTGEPADRLRVVAAAPQARVPIVLANGWTMDPFSAGNDKKATFSETGEVVWTVDFDEWVHQIVSHGDMVFSADGYLANDRIIDAWTAGDAKPTWSVNLDDLHDLGDGRGSDAISLTVVGDLLLAQWQHHLFALEPASGKLAWHLDIAKSLGDVDPWAVLWTKWGNPDATLAWDDDYLVMSWDRATTVLRLADQTWAWTLETDAIPHRPVPLVHDGVVYLMTGEGRALRK